MHWLPASWPTKTLAWGMNVGTHHMMVGMSCVAASMLATHTVSGIKDSGCQLYAGIPDIMTVPSVTPTRKFLVFVFPLGLPLLRLPGGPEGA